MVQEGSSSSAFAHIKVVVTIGGVLYATWLVSTDPVTVAIIGASIAVMWKIYRNPAPAS